VTAVPDGGCCGWAYEGNDQALLRHGQVSVRYDESDRYDNRHDAVSFYTADVRLAPGNATLAYTTASTPRWAPRSAWRLKGRKTPRSGWMTSRIGIGT
jgi:hypothetical protein